ncbi:hypothetical protein [Aeromonas enteropelogenes]|uniref:hypothetical protein n=1 Tax=Aeromonas enteropelogenes TaxID=29489 RepID=UPI0005A97884|nr:hypothetical protein [Aeromonas enteropelogenes]UBH51032.1 hypothetical protein LA321_13350 [Aeromonas enteropelogenes]
MTPVAAIREALLVGKLVGLGEPHWHPAFIRRQHAWLCDPMLWGVMTDLVLECGNRRHQGLLDTWLAGADCWQGEPLTLESLYPVWLDSSAFTAWMPPEFPALFAALRQSNLARPAQLRLRVHLCEPPFEWQELTPEAWRYHNRGRDQAMANCIAGLPERGVVVLAGARHLLKAAGDPHFSQPSLGQLLEMVNPGRLHVLYPWLTPAPMGEGVSGVDGLTTAEIFPHWPVQLPLDSLIDQRVWVAGAERQIQTCPILQTEPWRSRLRARVPLLPPRMASQLIRWLD